MFGVCTVNQDSVTGFGSVEIIGLTQPMSACLGLDGDAALRFVLLDERGAAIAPEDVYNFERVDLEAGSSFAVSGATLFELPDEACDGGCGQEGMSCQPVTLADGGEGPLRCADGGSAVALNGQPTFEGARDRELVLAVLMEHTGSLTGRMPEVLSAVFPDRDGDGITDQQWTTQTLVEPARATDRDAARVVMVRELIAGWKEVATRAALTRAQDARFGLWTFGDGERALQTMLPGEGPWARASQGAASEGGAVDQALDRYTSSPVATQKASVYEAMVGVLSDPAALASPEIAGASKALVVLVDGPDELRYAQPGAQDVIDAAKAAGARVYIVHLDPAVALRNAGDEPYFPDLPDYVEAQRGAGCAADFECASYEECRSTTGYALASGQEPTIPPGVDLTRSYCHIKRGADGRVGPVDAYAWIACETGGGYIYVPSLGDVSGDRLVARTRWLPSVLDGLWEAPLRFEALASGALEAGQSYKVGLEVSVAALGAQQTASMVLREEGDTRLVLCSGAR